MDKPNLVIQTAFFGDAILCIPLLKNLKRISPDRKLIFFCRKGLKEIFIRFGFVDEVIEVDKKNKNSYQSLISKLKSQSYYYLISPHESFRTHLIIRQLNAEVKIGYSQFWNAWVFNKRLARDWRLPEPLRQLSLLTCVDEKIKKDFAILHKEKTFYNCTKKSPIISEFINSPIPERWSLSPELKESHHNEREQLFQKLQISQLNFDKVIYLAPGSVWPTKQWTLVGFQELAKKLVDEGEVVLLVGSSSEKKICQKIHDAVPECYDLSGKTQLYDIALLFSKGKALVANDSSLLHFAAMMSLPVLGIFGPTTLSLGFRPWSSQSMVIQKELGCRPCGKHGHNRCPISTHECMTSITSNEIQLGLKNLVNHNP